MMALTPISSRVDYENIGQSEEQFKMLHGDESVWSKATLSGWDVLFNKSTRREAVKKHGIREQTIFAFLLRNKDKHEQMFTLSAMQKDYEAKAK